jgi:hypothetical protein
MTPFTSWPRWLLSGLALVILLAVLASRPVRILLIENVQDDQPVFAQAVRPGDNLALGFMHSVEHCRVWDHLQVDTDCSLIVVATEFAESRTGLPYAAFGDEVFERRKDHFRISNMHRRVPEIYQWVEAKYENTLKINGGEVVHLASLAGNTLLHMRVVSMTLSQWGYLKAELCWRNRSF